MTTTKTFLKNGFLIAMVSLFQNSICYSQQTKETIKGDNINTQVTISTLGTTVERKTYESTKSNGALQYFNQASQFADKNDLNNAKKYYLLAIQEDSEYVQAYDNLGIIYRRAGEFDKAIEKYKQSISLYPQGKVAHQNLASAYTFKKQYKNANKEYETLLNLDPNDPEGYFGYANSCMEQSQYEIALKNADKALELYQLQNSPLINEGQYLIGLIYYYKGDSSNAIKYLRLAKKNGAEINKQIAKELNL